MHLLILYFSLQLVTAEDMFCQMLYKAGMKWKWKKIAETGEDGCNFCPRASACMPHKALSAWTG